MAEDRTPDPADQPEDNDKSQPPEKPSEPYRLGGSGRSGKNPEGASGGGETGNPFEAFFSSLAGGDMNALAAQLQSTFAMLGGAGSMFGGGPTEPGSGVNWRSPRTLLVRRSPRLVQTPLPTLRSSVPSPRPSSSQKSGSIRPRRFPG